MASMSHLFLGFITLPTMMRLAMIPASLGSMADSKTCSANSESGCRPGKLTAAEQPPCTAATVHMHETQLLQKTTRIQRHPAQALSNNMSFHSELVNLTDTFDAGEQGPYHSVQSRECNTRKLRGWQYHDGIRIVSSTHKCKVLCDAFGSVCAGFDVKRLGSRILCVFHEGPISMPRPRGGTQCWIKG
jgi:hypothetical protein